MEVQPTNDGEPDDGVIWFRCPECLGFLPKIVGSEDSNQEDATPEDAISGESSADQSSSTAAPPISEPATKEPDTPEDQPGDMPWDSPAEMMAALEKKGDTDKGDTSDPDDEDILFGAEEALQAKQEKSQTVTPFAEEETGFETPDDPVAEASASPDTDEKDTPTPTKSSEEEPETPPEPLMEYAALLAEKDVAEATPYRHWGTYEVGQCIHHLAWDDCGVIVAKEDLPGGRKVIKCYFETAGVVRLIEGAPR